MKIINAWILLFFIIANIPPDSSLASETIKNDIILQNSDGNTEYHALLVGSGAWAYYRNSRDENLIADDVYTVRDTLRNNSTNWVQENIRVLVNGDVSEDNIDNEIASISSSMDSDDVFLFYYSGHSLGTVGIDLWTGEKLEPNELEIMLNEHIPEGAKSILLLATCFAGLYVDHFNNRGRDNTFILATSDHDEYTQLGLYRWFEWEGFFSHFIKQGLDGGADLNNDRIVSA
jgi:hypothetical protein